MNQRIFLIGMAGSGKTTVGKELSKTLGWSFIDTDKEIEKLEQKTISDIFKYNGEQYFEEKETEILKANNDTDKVVISTGGRTYLNKTNIDIIRSLGSVFYLKANVDTIYNRLSDTKELHKRRYLKNVKGKELKSFIKTLLETRHKYYRIGSIEVDANKSIKEIVTKIHTLSSSKRPW